MLRNPCILHSKSYFTAKVHNPTSKAQKEPSRHFRAALATSLTFFTEFEMKKGNRKKNSFNKHQLGTLKCKLDTFKVLKSGPHILSYAIIYTHNLKHQPTPFYYNR